MLYVTTRNCQDAVTVQHVLNGARGKDNGLYLPLHFPTLSEKDLERLSGMSFNQCVAEMLNLFFSTRLTGWDVDFCIGRYPVRMENLPYRTVMAELWHNPQWQYGRLEQNLCQLLGCETKDSASWPVIAVRMSVLAGILCEHMEAGEGTVDIASVSGDFSVPVSAWYLKKMGFPVGNIICCCNENKQIWDLLCHGQMRTDDVVISTAVPEADIVLPVNLERLIFVCGGQEETSMYLDACDSSGIYMISDDLRSELCGGLYVSVVSSGRVENAIPNVYNSYQYLMTPATALAYSGLMDYRSKTGITRTAVVVCDNSPGSEAETVANIMSIPAEMIRKMF